MAIKSQFHSGVPSGLGYLKPQPQQPGKQPAPAKKSWVQGIGEKLGLVVKDGAKAKASRPKVQDRYGQSFDVSSVRGQQKLEAGVQGTRLDDNDLMAQLDQALHSHKA